MAGTGVGKFSSTAGSNTANMTVNFAENMAPSNVNNAARELMGHMRDMYEQLGDGYFEFGDGDGTYTVARGDADTITITSAADISSVYFPGRKIRITDGGANVVEGTIASSSHASTTQTVNLTGISLAAGTPTKVELGIDTAAFGGRVILDDDGDTYIEAPTDDTIDIYVAGAKDFVITANTFTAESGSTIAAQALTATTIAASSTVTGTSFNAIPFYQGDTGSIYTHDVSGTDNSAQYNTAYGLTALDAITTGDNNTVIGHNAGGAINTGASNTLVGYQAGRDITDDSNNVAIGFRAGSNLTESSNVAIGSDAARLGTSFTDSVVIGTSAIGTGVATGTANIVIGKTAGEILTSASSNILVGHSAGQALTTGGDNIFIGQDAGDDHDAETNNLGIGKGSLGGSIAGGEYNVAIGNNTLDALTSADYNTAIGYNAGTAITTGAKNTILGAEAGEALASTPLNVIIGYAAGKAATTAAYNVIVGAEAVKTGVLTGNNNVIMGYEAGKVMTSAASNTVIGYTAGTALTTGAFNSFMGEEAGKSRTSGNHNVGIGYQANGANATSTGTENTCIGNYAGFGFTSGNSNVAVGYDCMYNLTTGSNNISIGNDAGVTGSPGGNLTTGSNTISLGDENIGTCNIQTDWTVASDQRDKTDFTALDIGLDFINDLKPYTYKWDKRSKYGDKKADDYDLNAQTPDGTHKEDWLDIGFKAQEVEVLEKAAGYKIAEKTNLTTSLTEDGKQYGIKYSKFVPILVKAIQELSAKVKALEEA